MARDEIPVLEVAESRYGVAAGLLERATQATGSDPNVLYMLALAHKRDGRPEQARAAFRRISRPDANVFLQLGLLSLQEGQPAQAEEEFGRATQADPHSFAAAYNLALTRLSLGLIDPAS